MSPRRRRSPNEAPPDPRSPKERREIIAKLEATPMLFGGYTHVGIGHPGKTLAVELEDAATYEPTDDGGLSVHLALSPGILLDMSDDAKRLLVHQLIPDRADGGLR